MMTGYLRQNNNITIAEKTVDTALSMESSQFKTQRRSSTTTAVNMIPCRVDYFGHELNID